MPTKLNKTVHLIWRITAGERKVVAVCANERILENNLTVLRHEYPLDIYKSEEMPLLGAY